MDNISIAAKLIPAFQKRGPRLAFSQQIGESAYRNVSCTEYAEQILQMSLFLQERKIQAGDRVFLLSENCPEWTVAALACLNLGAVLTPVNSVCTTKEAKDVLQKSQAKFAFFSESCVAFQNLEKSELPEYCTWNIQVQKPLAKILSKYNPTDFKATNVDPESTAILIYTSGTTGNPKAVPLTHKNILINAKDVLDVLDLSENDSVVSVLPLSHMLEFTCGFLVPAIVGFRINYVKSFKGEDIIATLKYSKSTVMVGVPLLFEVMARTLGQKLDNLPQPLKSIFKSFRSIIFKYPELGKTLLFPIHRALGGRLRCFVAGGAKLQPWVYDFFKSIGIRMVQGYGLTETAPVLAASNIKKNAADHTGTKMKSIELAIFSEQGKKLNSDQEGEICAKGPSIFAGYEDPEHNKSAFRDGWFRTGDLGTIDELGNLRITGRIKDIIVSPGGKNIYPEEIEQVVIESGKFLEVAVLSLLDDSNNEKVGLVGRPDRTKFNFQEENELEKLMQQSIKEATKVLADYKQPQKIVLYEEEFPKTHTRKVKRHALRQEISKHKKEENIQTGKTLDLDKPLERRLAQEISSIIKKPIDQIQLKDSLVSDLGIDSLTFVEIISAVENNFSVQIDEIEFSQIETVEDLVNSLNPYIIGNSKQRSLLDKIQLFKEFDPISGEKPQWFVPRFFINLFIRIFMRIFCQISYEGLERSKDKNTAYIFTPNHTSHFDTISLLSTLPQAQIQNTYAVAAKDYFFNNSLKAFSARLFFNAIPFDRKKRVDAGMEKCKHILKHKGSLIIFPEGTRSPDGKINSFKHGVGHLLANNPGVKAIPVYIDGAHKVFPKGRALPKPGKITVRFGNSLSFEDLAPSSESYKTIAEALESEVRKLEQK